MVALVLSLSLSLQLTSQEKVTVYGVITDSQSGEHLIGAYIIDFESQKGGSTNQYGFYSVTLPFEDSLILSISYLGYESQIVKVYQKGERLLNIAMDPIGKLLSEVEVKDSKTGTRLKDPQMSVVTVPLSRIKSMPAILAESDILKVIQLLPGVQSGNEGTTGFFVRGGKADQNLVLLDEAVVYNPNHLFGLLSTFNTNAINNAQLIKGGFPAQYGGRLSSILNISMREGNKNKFAVTGGIGLLSTNITIEGPIVREKASFILSGRRTYMDLLLKPLLPKNFKTDYHFYDLNAKINYQLSEKDRIYLSFFNGRDKAEYKQAGISYDIGFGNRTTTLRWNHLFNEKLFAKLSLIQNHYDQDIKARQDNANSHVVSGINDLTAKYQIQFFPNPSHKLKLGGEFIAHEFRSEGDARFQPGTQTGGGSKINKIPKKKFNEWAVYINDEYNISPYLSLQAGIRFPFYKAGKAHYQKWEPRIAINWSIDKRTAIKTAYTRMNQFIHLVPGSTSSVPYDIWVPSTDQTKPQNSQQIAVGLFKNFFDNAIESSVEFYYKDMRNQVLFEEGNQLVQTLDLDELLSYGRGWSYGGEFFVQKNSGKWNGWLSYTLSWTEQKFNDLNFGKAFPFRFDRRHNLALTGSYHLSDKWSFSSSFVYSSGPAFTVPTGRFHAQHGGSLFEGNYFIYEQRNNVRMNPYHRLDISASYKKKRKVFGREYESEWVFSIYNLYSRANPYFIYFQIDPVTDQPMARQVSLLPIIPSASFNFKF